MFHVVNLGESFNLFCLLVEPLRDPQLGGSQVADQMGFSILNLFGKEALEGHEEVQFGLPLFSHLPLPLLCRSSDLFLELVPPKEERKGVFEASVFCDQVQEGRLEGLVLRDLRGDLETWLVGWRVVDCVVHLGVGELDDVGQMIGEGDACVVRGVDPGLAPGIAAI